MKMKVTGQSAERARRDLSGRERAARAGMTLIELLVALAVLAIMILLANALLIRSRGAVRQSEQVIAANADVRAVADRIRNDLSGITKDGFLAIVYEPPQPPDDEPPPHLIFTAVGTTRGPNDLDPGDLVTNVATIDYGLADEGANEGILWRRARIGVYDLDEAYAVLQPDDLTGQTFPRALGQYRYTPMPRHVIHGYLMDPQLGLALPPTQTMVVPPTNLGEVEDLWPYMIGRVTALRIQWTNDQPGGAVEPLGWYDKDNPAPLPDGATCQPPQGLPAWPKWPDRNFGFQEMDLRQNLPEYNGDGAGANPAKYCALWTWKKTDNWPKALRIRLTLGEKPDQSEYEIIVALPE